MSLLKKVATDEGFESVHAMLEAAAIDSVSPGICTVCRFTCSEIEPDAEDGYCEHCGANTVKSVLIIAGLI